MQAFMKLCYNSTNPTPCMDKIRALTKDLRLMNPLAPWVLKSNSTYKIHPCLCRLLDTTDSSCPMCRDKVSSESLNKLDHPNLQHIHDEE